MKKIAFSLGALILILDQITKRLALAHSEILDGYHGYPVIEGFIKLQLVSNRGIAFGLLHSVEGVWKPVVLSVIALIALIALIVYVFHTPERERTVFVSYGLLLGGILGNFHDRIFRGEVTDFITLHWGDAFAWPTFNIADAAISTGVFLLLFSTFFLKGKDVSSSSAALVLGIFLLAQNPAGDARDSSLDAVSVLEQVESGYRDMESFTAEFLQAFSSRGISSTERGIVEMKRPAFMRWEYRKPEHKVFIADGEKTYFYLEEENQLLVSAFDIESSNSPLLFFLGKGDFMTRYSASLVNGEEGIFVRLVPRSPDPDIEELVMEIGEDDFLIRRIVVRDPIGQQNEYILTNMRKNVHIPRERFEIEVPGDVEIIEQ